MTRAGREKRRRARDEGDDGRAVRRARGVVRARGDAAGAAEEGLEFYLMPDFGKLFAGNTPAEQWATFGDAVYAALGQAFFTVSVGMGSMAIFGSYIGKDRSPHGRGRARGRARHAGCAHGGARHLPSRASPSAWSRRRGPSLVFITLPIVFERDAPGAAVGHTVFPVHELCRAVDGDCRVREHS